MRIKSCFNVYLLIIVISFANSFLARAGSVHHDGLDMVGNNSDFDGGRDFLRQYLSRYKLIFNPGTVAKKDGEYVDLVDSPKRFGSIIRNLGFPDLSNEDLFALDRELQNIVDTYFRPTFGKYLGPVEFFIFNTHEIKTSVLIPTKIFPIKHEEKFTDAPIKSIQYKLDFNLKRKIKIFKEKEPVVIILDRWVIDQCETLDELVAVIGHELSHYLQSQVVSESGFDKALKGMSGEKLMDAKSAQILLQQGLNPLAMSMVIEKILNHKKSFNYSSSKDSNESVMPAALFSHPPDEVRLTLINALIERWANRHLFPALKPLPATISKLKKLEKKADFSWKAKLQREVRYYLAESYPELINFNLVYQIFSDDSFYYWYQEWLKKQPKENPYLGYVKFRKNYSDDYSRGFYPGEYLDLKLENYIMDAFVTDALELIEVELERVFELMTPENINKIATRHALEPQQVFDWMTSSLYRLQTIFYSRGAYNTQPSNDLNWLRGWSTKSHKVRKFFQKIDLRLKSHAKKVGVKFVSSDEKYRLILSEFSKIKTMDDFNLWKIKNWTQKTVKGVLFKKKYQFYIWQASVPMYSIVENPKLLLDTLKHYIQLAPMLVEYLNSNDYSKASVQNVLLVKSFFEDLADQFFLLNSDKKNQQKIEKDITSLNLTPVERLLVFYNIGKARECYSSINKNPLFIDAINEFISNPTQSSKLSFDEFHKELRKLMRFDLGVNWGEEEKDAKPRPSEEMFSNTVVKLIPEYQGWVFKALKSIHLKPEDVPKILASDYYWYSSQQELVQSYVDAVKAVNDRVNDEIEESEREYDSLGSFFEHVVLGGVNGFREWKESRRDIKAFKKRKESFDDEVKERVTKKVEKTFYSRNEYKADLSLAQKNQIFLFEILFNSNQNFVEELKNIENEFQYWVMFAKRGVTDFTDEWAEKILDRALYDESSPNIKIVQSLYFSQLIWDLRVRDRLARIIYNPKYSALTKTALTVLQKPKLREKLILELAVDIEKYFPENSREKQGLFNYVANTIQTDKRETINFRGLLGITDGLPNSDIVEGMEINDGEALGIRVVAQLFTELKSASISEKIEVINFLLGNTDVVPKIFTGFDGAWNLVKTEFEKSKHRNDPQLRDRAYRDVLNEYYKNFMSVRVVVEVLGVHRARRLFQAMEATERAAILDPLILGKDGILVDPNGREWIINSLVPKDANWRQLAIDLTDGYVDALTKLGQSHLKTLFISYLLASSAKTSRGKYHDLLYGKTDAVIHEHDDSDKNLKEAGVILRKVFEASAALAKIGQRLHSSHVFPLTINNEIESIKDQTPPLNRDEYFYWLEDAARCNDICEAVKLLDVKGNASVKVVMGAMINGNPAVIHLIRPNAINRGELSFQLIEHALNYALSKGHDDVRVVIPMVARSRETFKREISLNAERESQRHMAQMYKPGQSYAGYQFTTPELLSSFDSMVDPDRIEAVHSIEVKRFSELTDLEKTSVAKAIADKEADNLLNPTVDQNGIVHFDKDRHEGNFLFVTDKKICEKLNIEPGKLILVIDPGQFTSIAAQKQEAIFEGIALLAAVKMGFVDQELVVKDFSRWFFANVAVDRLELAEQRAEKQKLLESIVQTEMTKSSESKELPEVMLSILAYAESHGMKVDAGIWDYLTAFGTSQTWIRYFKDQAPNPFQEKGLEKTLQAAKCSELLRGPLEAAGF